jgi:hypothetical protein
MSLRNELCIRELVPAAAKVMSCISHAVITPCPAAYLVQAVYVSALESGVLISLASPFLAFLTEGKKAMRIDKRACRQWS